MAETQLLYAIIALSSLLLGTSYGGTSIFPLMVRPRLDGRIVGGGIVDIQAVPFQVSLQRSFHFCGGSLIAKNIVLTAAHCTEGSQAAAIKVRIGSTMSDRGGVLVKVAHIVRHPKYNSSTIDYDFSLLMLEDYDNTGLKSDTVALPSAEQDWADGTQLTVAGWGNTQVAHESREALRAVTVPKFNQDACNIAYTRYGGITDRMLCAGLPEGGKDACQGDSGGPLFRHNILVGVVSWGFGCAMPSYPGVYARVTAVRSWIADMTGL